MNDDMQVNAQDTAATDDMQANARDTSATTASTGQTQQITPGTEVFDASGETIGVVGEYNPDQGYMIIRQGWAFPQDTRVPLDAIRDTSVSGIYLNADKDDLVQQYGGGSGDTGVSTEREMASTNAGSSSATMTDTGDTSTTMEATSDNTGVTTESSVDRSNTMSATTSGMQDTVSSTSTGTTGMQGATRTDMAAQGETDEIRVPVMEEQLVVGKRQDEVGRVHLRKDVVEEEQSVDVPLQQERVYVERVPVDEATDTANVTDAFQERDIDVPVMGEEAVVEKRAQVAEEVRLHKDVMTENQNVSDTVRKERVVIDQPEGEGIEVRDDMSSVGTTGTDTTMQDTSGEIRNRASGESLGDRLREGVDRLTGRDDQS